MRKNCSLLLSLNLDFSGWRWNAFSVGEEEVAEEEKIELIIWEGGTGSSGSGKVCSYPIGGGRGSGGREKLLLNPTRGGR